MTHIRSITGFFVCHERFLQRKINNSNFQQAIFQQCAHLLWQLDYVNNFSSLLIARLQEYYKYSDWTFNSIKRRHRIWWLHCEKKNSFTSNLWRHPFDWAKQFVDIKWLEAIVGCFEEGYWGRGGQGVPGSLLHCTTLDWHSLPQEEELTACIFFGRGNCWSLLLN